MEVIQQRKTNCYHCGDICRQDPIVYDDKRFCCDGCKLVYDVLRENDMCSYYRYNDTPGNSPKGSSDGRFGYLDDSDVKGRLLRFDEGGLATIVFHIPGMHCSSCIWLLEHLQRINPSVIRSRVSFLDRQLTVVFRQDRLSLRGLVEMLSMIGYEPLIRMDDLEGGHQKESDRSAVYRIGVAGFAFGNIMLFSFPEYLSLGDSAQAGYRTVFNYLNLLLSIPVFFYCSKQFFRSAFKSIHQRFLNIDVPIALGILVMFVRSVLDVLLGYGPGYFDTMAGLVFFMLIGRYFQDKTYSRISFDRDYKSFFPVSVMVERDGKFDSLPLSRLEVGDVIMLRNEEIIPADSKLLSEEAAIDYSFVTGESFPVRKSSGDTVFAGGRHKGPSIRLSVLKPVAQSYLTQLWNEDRYSDRKDETALQLLVDRISHYFTFVIISVASLALMYWLTAGQPARAWDAFTTVLIIACPCALAISSPFTLGSILRIFGREGFYLRGYPVIERLSSIDAVVFDKTGTLTVGDGGDVDYFGETLTVHQKNLVFTAALQSAHPLSRILCNYLSEHGADRIDQVERVNEVLGKGLIASVLGSEIIIGSREFVASGTVMASDSESEIYCAIDGRYLGRFKVRNTYRRGISSLFSWLKKTDIPVHVLTGDNGNEKERLDELSGHSVEFRYRQLPEDKLRFVQALQQDGKKVLMVGDGLNDAGALRQAHFGLSVSEDINNFSPACDGIINGEKLSLLGAFIAVARAGRGIIIGAFSIALVYNIVGCWFAVQGELSPVIAAILMPVSTVTIIAFTTGLSSWFARKVLIHDSVGSNRVV